MRNLRTRITEPLFHLETDESKTVKVLAVTNGLGEGVYVIEFDVNGQEYKIGLNVDIQNSKRNKGKISFEYQSLDQLNKIIDLIKTYY